MRIFRLFFRYLGRRKRQPARRNSAQVRDLQTESLGQLPLNLSPQPGDPTPQFRVDEPGVRPEQYDYPELFPIMGGLRRRCDLCEFTVNGTEPAVLTWALRDHMYRTHPTKARR